MTHCGSLGNQEVSDDIRDVRGTVVRGSDGEELGKLDDVIFDHGTMEIRYLVVDSGDRSEAGTFLLPADRVAADENHEDGLATGVTRQQIENSPPCDRNSLRSDGEWEKYEQKFVEYWEDKPVMHLKGSDRIIVPPDAVPPVPASSSRQKRSSSATREVSAAELFPRRISEVFSDPAPSAGKVTLRPESVARAEEAASGAAMLKPRWWDAFENYLRDNKSDIQSKCSQCGPISDQKGEVA
jgi:sporulation protein YlmC with PRC-barrel domain